MANQAETPDDKAGAAAVVLGEGRFLRLIKKGSWEIAERVGAAGAVIVVATTKENELILMRQWREAVGKFVWEMPAGLRDIAGEEAVETGIRELAEETGFSGEKAQKSWTAPVSPGMSNEMVDFVRIKNCQRTTKGGGIEGEVIEVKLVRVPLVPAFLSQKEKEGDMVDAKMYAALWAISQEKEEKPKTKKRLGVQ